MSHDAAGWLLAGAVRLLPDGRREWGRAMHAELAGIGPVGARWRFALGCLGVVTRQRMTLRAVGYLVLAAGVLAGVVGLTRTIAYAPLRGGLIALVSILVAMSWLGRRRAVFGPVGTGRASRLAAAGAYVLVGAMALTIVLDMRGPGLANPDDKATNGVPIYTVLLTLYLVGFLAATAHRCAATGRVLATGVASGLGATACWLALVLAMGSIPADLGPALGFIGVAMGVAGFVNSGRRGSAALGQLAGLFAGALAALLIVIVVWGLAGYGPASLIPDLAPAALSPAADLAQSRVEINDPYVGLLALGCLAAAALTAVSVATRRPASDDHRALPAGELMKARMRATSGS